MRTLLYAIIALCCLWSCNMTRKTKSNTIATISEHWLNPVISPSFSHPGIEAIFRQDLGPGENHLDKEGIQHFCTRLNKQFASSQLSNEQAHKIYLLLYQSGHLANESVGMPDPDDTQPRETLATFKKRVAIRYTHEGNWEAFYQQSGCGFTYAHIRIELKPNQELARLTTLESWRILIPC